MKKILLMFLFGTMTMFSQTIKVRGVILSYDKVKKVMTLTTTPKIMYTNDINMDVKIELHKEFALRMTINGVNYSMTEAYFKHTGSTRDMGWCFVTYKPGGCKEIKNNYVYQFTDVKPGEEYILTVSNICDDKYVTNEQTMSIQIN
jgi:hypothetical protein